MRPFVLSLCLHFACLLAFSWMRSKPAIHRFRSGFHEPKTSHAHGKMLWHRWFYPNTVDRTVWHAFIKFHVLAIALAMQYSRVESHAHRTSYTCHPMYSNHFSGRSAFFSPGWRIPTHSEHGTRFRYFYGEFKAPKHRERLN